MIIDPDSNSVVHGSRFELSAHDVIDFVLSRRIALSNSANAPTICIIMRPGAVVVSIASVKLLNPASASLIRSTTKNPETKTQAARPKKKPLPQNQIVWQAWKDLRLYRYRTGSRYAGRGNWERYLIFESPRNVHLSEISYGSAKASDVLLSPSNPVAKIVLLSTSASHWKWNASLSSAPKVPEHN